MKGDDLSRRIGHVLAGEVLKLVSHPQPVLPTRVAATSESLTLQRRLPHASEVDRARAALSRSDLTPQDHSQAMAAVALAQTAHRTAEAEVQCVRIGDLALVGLPGEIFVDYALAVKAQYTNTFVISLANGELQGYIVTEKAAREGGYEASNSLFRPEAGRVLVDATLEILGDV